jgi:hypothetical protein
LPEIKACYAQIGPNQVCEGFYTVENGILSMCKSGGTPVGKTFALRPGDDAHALAVVFTKELRKQLRGETVEGFTGHIEYPEWGLA